MLIFFIFLLFSGENKRPHYESPAEKYRFDLAGRERVETRMKSAEERI